MRAQGFGRVKVPREFRFGQGRVNLVVANLMNKNGRPALAALEFGDQVMMALFDTRRDRAQAKGADRVGVGHVERGSGQARLVQARGSRHLAETTAR